MNMPNLQTTKLTRTFAIAILFSISLAAVGTARDYDIRFKSGLVRNAAQDRDQKLARFQESSTTGARRCVVQFDTPVDRAHREQLTAAGLTLQTSLGNNAFIAQFDPAQADFARLADDTLLAHIQPINVNWKLHPMIIRGTIPPYAIIPQTTADTEARGLTIGAYILFHPDVPLATGERIAANHGANVRDRIRSVNGLVIELPLANIPALAAMDEVLWIEPPLPHFEAVNDSNRQLVGANIVQSAPYNLDGSGIRALIFDAGQVALDHPDFEGRIVNDGDTSGVISHATHVAGTVGGSGEASGGLFRGMAPNCDLITFGFQWDDAQGVFLYANPGDIEQDYEDAITNFDADISNNSIGTNTCWNGFPCEITGDYGVTDQLIDSMVTGAAFGSPFRIVWANGNERSCPFCGPEHTPEGFHSSAPPACAKNQVAVGAVNSNDDSMTDFSSWGPCDDGRMKPDIVAPGCQSNADQGVTSCSAFGDYESLCGTSMASPTVCGLGVLLLEDFRNQFPKRPDFRNSTLRTILAHTAEDWGDVGPDYSSGYGSVRIQPAIDFMRSGNFLEAEVDQGGTYSVLVIVNPGDPFMKVTIAWDDPANAPLVEAALINDLDLVVYDPSGAQVFPWTLNPEEPGEPAVQTQLDRLNNIEQVFRANPEPGVYRVEVQGFNVPQGPQTFSIAGSPMVVNCSTRGVVSLDRSKYACSNTATIQVVDCDLNTNDETVETLNVVVYSSLEPAGEQITLEESGGATALFRGTINLSINDATGVLLIGDGASVTAKYIDADDGFGGTNVDVVDAAVVDCVPPTVLSVEATNILPYNATIHFVTNESARASVRYGLSCDALDGLAAEEDFSSTHDVLLSGLAEDTVYFYAIDVVDTVANETTFNAGGTCYAFGTADIPNFFTQEINGISDLQFTTIDFTPNDTVDRYDACVVTISSLPTDPSIGTPLTLPNDGFAQVQLADGALVTLYGVDYPSFFVGSNGYITFTAGDNDGSESLTDHFDTPRISALFDNLNPTTGGTISWLQLGNRAVVTWENVPDGAPNTMNTVQVEMYFDGRITISYLALSTTDGIVGLSDGEGLSEYFAESDLNAFGTCGPRPPRAQRVNAFTVVDTPVTIMLLANDDGLPNPPGALEYLITQLPIDGTLSDPNAGSINAIPYVLANNGAQVLYTPDAGDTGSDNFRFAARDGGVAPEGGESGPALVLLTVDLDCNLNAIGDPFDLADGTSLDCNVNAIPDECDIATGHSFDCEPDAIPDECQADCNNNGMTDACDIAGAISNDCNANTIPDECDLAGWANNFFATQYDPPLAIVESGTTQVIFHVDADVPIVDVNVHLDITHPRTGDLWIALRHNGLSAVLADRCGGDGDNYTGTVFDDEAVTEICAGTSPFFGDFIPDRPFSIFDGQSMQGDWVLLVRDTVQGNAGTLNSWVLHLPVGSPDCNINAVPDDCEPDCNGNDRVDECDITDGVSMDANGDGIPDECSPPLTIVSSNPPNGAIDARQPTNINGKTIPGWSQLEVTFSSSPGAVLPIDFTVTSTHGIVPVVTSAVVNGSVVNLTLSNRIPPGAWTKITHGPSSSSVCLGYLPADTNADRSSSPVDILHLIDCINGVNQCMIWQTDLDRSGVTNPADILRVIDLLNGADAFEVWNGQTLGASPCQ